MVILKKFSLLLLIISFMLCITITKSFAYSFDYSSGISQEDFNRLNQRIPITSPRDNSIDWNFTKFTPREDQTIQNNHSNGYSGSTHFIYSSSPNPRYCMPGSSYSICH